MYIDQHLQNGNNNWAFMLVVLHKKPPESSHRRLTAAQFLEIVLKDPRVFCALHHKICEIIFTQYTYIVLRDMH